MSLQRRLTLFFILIVILPLTAAGFIVQRVVVGEIEQRARLSLRPALNAAVVIYNDRVEDLDGRVRATLGLTAFADLLHAGSSNQISDFLRVRIDGATGLDFLIALDRHGRLLGFASKRGSFAPGFEVPGPDEILEAETGVGPGFNRTAELPLKVAGRGVAGKVVGGFWLDEKILVPSDQEGVQLSLVFGREVVASSRSVTKPIEPAPEFGETFDADINGASLAEARQLPGGASLIAWTARGPIDSRSRQVVIWMLGLLVLAILATAGLAHLLARLTTQDLDDLADGARSIAEGRFDTRIEVRSKDEVGVLATAFNDMAERLSDTITELSDSRDRLQRSVRRVAETLRATHDMKQLLESIMNTGVDAVQADSASLWRFTPTREELYPVMGRGADLSEMDRLKVGEGIVGLVAERGVTVTLPDPGAGPKAARGEPDKPVTVAVPLYSDGRIAAVLALYRDDPEKPFTPGERNTVIFLAEASEPALENVALHEEAQRLSLMDGLTGIYNRRYLQMQFRQVLATATRFERPFSVLMMDLDHFKHVNDTHGHQRGDAILIEFSQRVTRLLREVDTFARYGGEEFVVLLSETDEVGAVTTAEKIVDSIRSDPFGGQGETPIDITVSVGVAAYPHNGDSWRSIIEAADRALYEAKEQGRDRVCTSGDKPPSDLRLAT